MTSLPSDSVIRAPARWQAYVFGLIAVVACAATFVGLSNSGFWIDELFTVYLIKHYGGVAEVFRRQLTDTHPPLYPIFLHLWAQLAGFSEWALRLPSAIFAVLAVGIFAAGTRRVLSPAAIAFACAIATLSDFWFFQSQNARSYALCMALAATLLSEAIAFRRRVRVGPGFPVAHWIGLTLLGLVASLTHAYLLLALGMILFFLIITTRAWRIRAALIATGLIVLAPNVIYYYMLMHSSDQDLHNLWFSNSVDFFYQQTRQALTFFIAGQLAIVGLLLLVFRVRQWIMRERTFVWSELDSRWAAYMAIFALIGVVVCGIGVSLAIAPSY